VTKLLPRCVKSLGKRQMNYKTLIDEFINNFPDLTKLAEEDTWWKGDEEYEPNVYVFVGSIFNRYLIEQLSILQNEDLLNRIFDFLESMAVSEDASVREVLTDGILEVLGDDKQILERARAFMKSNTLRMSHEVEKSWGREV
jgi:hypothetical protein